MSILKDAKLKRLRDKHLEAEAETMASQLEQVDEKELEKKLKDKES